MYISIKLKTSTTLIERHALKVYVEDQMYCVQVLWDSGTMDLHKYPLDNIESIKEQHHDWESERDAG